MKKIVVMMAFLSCATVCFAQDLDSTGVLFRVIFGGTTCVNLPTAAAPAGIDISERAYLPGFVAGGGLDVKLSKKLYLRFDLQMASQTVSKRYFKRGLQSRYPTSEIHFPFTYNGSKREASDLGNVTSIGLRASVAYLIVKPRGTWLPMLTFGIQENAVSNYKFVTRVPQTNDFTRYTVTAKPGQSLYVGLGCDWMLLGERVGGLTANIGYTQPFHQFEIATYSPQAGSTSSKVETKGNQLIFSLGIVLRGSPDNVK